MNKKDKKEIIKLIHPGEILMEEFLTPLSLTQYRLAKDINVPPRRINEIVKEIRAISADTAIRFSIYFGTTAEFWMNLQAKYDLDITRNSKFDKIKSIIVSRSVA